LSYLLDTSILIGILREEPNARKMFEYLFGENKDMFICTLSITQILSKVRKNENFDKTKDFLNLFIPLSVNKEISSQTGTLGYDLVKKGKTIPDIDDLIINILCQENDLILVTSNIKHFPNLKNKILEYKY